MQLGHNESIKSAGLAKHMITESCDHLETSYFASRPPTSGEENINNDAIRRQTTLSKDLDRLQVVQQAKVKLQLTLDSELAIDSDLQWKTHIIVSIELQPWAF